MRNHVALQNAYGCAAGLSTGIVAELHIPTTGGTYNRSKK